MERCHARRAWPPVSGLPFAITPSKQMILVGVCETCAAKDDATLLREGFTELRRESSHLDSRRHSVGSNPMDMGIDC